LAAVIISVDDPPYDSKEMVAIIETDKTSLDLSCPEQLQV